MKRRSIVKGGLVALGTASLPKFAISQSAPSSVRIGYAISLSGPFAPGAESTSWSQYKLWAKDVNDAGGLMLKKYNRKVPIELIAYDDRSQLDEAIKLAERLVLNDKVDLVLPPWGTGNNMAVAAVLNKLEYPVLYWTCAGARVAAAAKMWPYSFFPLGQPQPSAEALTKMLTDLKAQNKIQGRIALIYAAEQFGVDMHTAMAAEVTKAKLDVVISKSYPLGASDLSGLMREVQRANPEAFFAFSYPTDTFMLTEQAQIQGFSPPIFYTGIGTPFPGYKAKFGAKTDGVLLFGGHELGAPGQREYLTRHKAMFNRDSESGAMGMYSCLQVLQQSIERVGEIDRKKIRDEIAGGRFQTITGEFQMHNQMLADAWVLGQWQNGEVVGIAPSTRKGAKPMQFPKPKWA